MIATKKRSLSLILTLMMILAFALSASAAPKLNSNGVYEIATADDMVWFREQVAAGNTAINAKLTANIDLSGSSWAPIWYAGASSELPDITGNYADNSAYWYGGTFDGNGKTITLRITENVLVRTKSSPATLLDGLYADMPIYGGGLFLGLANSAVVKNLTLKGTIDLYGTTISATADKRFSVAPLVAQNRGVIYNVNAVDFAFSATSPVDYSFFGGLAAMNIGESALIDNCTVTNGQIRVGGNVFYAHSGLIAADNYAATIKNVSVLNSQITFDGLQNGMAGGVVAMHFGKGSISNATVDNLTVDFALTPYDESQTWWGASSLGGIAGHINGENSWSNAVYNIPIGQGKVANAVVSNSKIISRPINSATGDNMLMTQLVGGIVGDLTGGRTSAQSITLEDSKVVDSTIEVSGNLRMRIGGLAGRITRNAVVQRCLVEESGIETTLTGFASTSSYQDINNINLIVGGLVGNPFSNTTATDTIMESSIREITNSIVKNVTIDILTDGGPYPLEASYQPYIAAGMLMGYANSSAEDVNEPMVVSNCAVTGNGNEINYVFRNATHVRAYTGALAGYMRVSASDCIIGHVEVTSNDIGLVAPNGKVSWYHGQLAGYLHGLDSGTHAANLINVQFADTLEPADTIYATPTTSSNRDIDADTKAIPYTDDETFDTLFVSLLGLGIGEIPLGEAIDVELLIGGGTGGIDLDGVVWSSGDGSVIKVTDLGDGKARIEALAPGTTTITVEIPLAGGGTQTETFTVTVPMSPEYAYITPETSGTHDPKDTIVPGEDVEIEYDYGDGNTVTDVDDSGLDGSGLTAKPDGNGGVIVEGEADNPGNYYFDVEITDENGNKTIQREEITIGVAVTTSGTPDPDNIYPGDSVDITYTFGNGSTLKNIDASGLNGSGLSAGIVNGKVIMQGTANKPGNYFYEVELEVNGKTVKQKVEVTVRAEATITGTPEDGVIYPNDEVDLTYDFGNDVTVNKVDGSGLAGSGLGVTIDANGNVSLTGTATTPGTYYYDVELIVDGKLMTQRMEVVVEDGSRPTSRSGGGSSSCNSGVGSAVFALLGLAVVAKKK